MEDILSKMDRGRLNKVSGETMENDFGLNWLLKFWFLIANGVVCQVANHT